jgi:hypothetical protein
MVLWCSGILLEMMCQQIDAEDIERWLRRLLPAAAGSLPFRLSARGCGFESAASQCHPKAIRRPKYPESHTPIKHQVSDWGSGAAANFDWMREAKRENTRCGL